MTAAAAARAFPSRGGGGGGGTSSSSPRERLQRTTFVAPKPQTPLLLIVGLARARTILHTYETRAPFSSCSSCSCSSKPAHLLRAARPPPRDYFEVIFPRAAVNDVVILLFVHSLAHRPEERNNNTSYACTARARSQRFRFRFRVFFFPRFSFTSHLTPVEKFHSARRLGILQSVFFSTRKWMAPFSAPSSC